MQYLLIDLDLPQMRPLARLRSIFSVRNGVYSPIERLRLKDPEGIIHYLHPDPELESHLAEITGVLAYKASGKKRPDMKSWLGDAKKIRADTLELSRNYAQVLFSSELNFFSALDQIGGQIEKDILLWSKYNPRLQRFFIKKFQIIGSRRALYLHKTAKILPGVVLDTRSGPIVLDANVLVSPFSYLRGPLYAGPGACLDNVSISGGTILGRAVRVSGEIENSIIGDFSNKHHEGFVGHSIIGAWVNIGALTTTSDLKNNYGEIRLRLPKTHCLDTESMVLHTHRIKFGAIIGDYVKTAIGCLINSGTVIDSGSNVFGGSVPAYLPPFSWGVGSPEKFYEQRLFLRDAKKIADRRSQSIPPIFDKLVAKHIQNVKKRPKARSKQK